MKNPGELILNLMNARTVAHVMHLSVSGPGSLARHLALKEFYEGVVDLADRFAEAYIGCYGELIKFSGVSYKLEKDPMAMLSALKETVAKARSEEESTMLQQILDDTTELIASTMYKIKNLA